MERNKEYHSTSQVVTDKGSLHVFHSYFHCMEIKCTCTLQKFLNTHALKHIHHSVDHCSVEQMAPRYTSTFCHQKYHWHNTAAHFEPCAQQLLPYLFE